MIKNVVLWISFKLTFLNLGIHRDTCGFITSLVVLSAVIRRSYCNPRNGVVGFFLFFHPGTGQHQ